jgi:hypothetical protein
MNTREWLPFLFCMGVLFFNWPMLEVVRISLPYYLYGVWALLICLTAVIVALNRGGRQG